MSHRELKHLYVQQILENKHEAENRINTITIRNMCRTLNTSNPSFQLQSAMKQQHYKAEACI